MSRYEKYFKKLNVLYYLKCYWVVFAALILDIVVFALITNEMSNLHRQWSEAVRGVQGYDPDSVVRQTNAQKPAALLPDRYSSQSHTYHICRHLLTL